jgi:hypothetical protein
MVSAALGQVAGGPANPSSGPTAPPPTAGQNDPIIGLPADPNYGNCFPFGCAYNGSYQQVYISSQFSGPITITGLSFYNTQVNDEATAMNSGTWTISLSTTSKNLDTLSTTFSNNIGPDNTQVFSGNLAQSWAFGDTLAIVLTTPFTYNPSSGNLLMTVVATGTTAPDGFIYFDTNGEAEEGGDTIMGRVYCSEVEGAGVDCGPTGLVDSGFGLVTDISSAVVSKETLTVTETGLGAGTVTDTTYPPVSPTPINCAEAGGGVAQTGVCSETDAPGTMVTLTETPGTTAGGLSTFGGWGPVNGPCAYAGTNPTCTLTMNSAQNVTASFVAPPVSYNLTFSPGTNVTQSALLCYGQPLIPPSPCPDPNASQLTITTPMVMTEFPLTVLVTEFSDNGLCSPGGNGQSSQLACRFGSFFNYGTDPNGNTIAPLCYGYLNGSCAQYLLYDTNSGPHTAFPPGLTSGDFYLDFGFNNTSAISNLTSYWANSTPRVFDDPDGNEFPGLPYGTDCSSPMLVGPPPGTTYLNPQGQEVYCQFDKDVTTFYTPGPGLDPIGGRIPATNNLVVAFVPTTTGNNPVQTPPTSTAPAITGSCVTGTACVLSGGSLTFAEGMGGTFQVTVTAGYPAPNLTELGALPTGLTFNAATGTISGTPADGADGTSYPITVTATNGSGSAVLSYTLTVAPAALTITASSATVAYGTGIPTITPTISGLVNGDGNSVLGTITCSAAVPAGNPVGTWPTTCSGASDPTYAITPVPGTLQITAVPLIITSSSPTIASGTTPVITPTYSGFVNGDSPSSLTMQPNCTTTATSTSLPGSYPSTCSGAVDPNYTISYVPGTVTVVGLEISPLTVNFGQLYWGQIGIQGIVLKNTGTTPITITSINHAGGTAPGDFGDLSFCPPMILKLPATLPAGKSCAIGVGILATAKVFSPTASTTYLTITDGAASQPVLLTALVINPQAAFSSTYLSSGKLTFPTTTEGNSNEQTITVTNPGNTPLILGNPAISVSSSSGYFTLTSTTCNGATVDTTSEGGVTSCVINVTFAPNATGTFTGTLKIKDNAWNGPKTISLSGSTGH